MTKASLGWWAGERFWQCTEHVFSGARHDFRGHQCLKAAKFDHDEDGNPTKCGVHKQEAKDKRAAKFNEKMEAKFRQMDRQATARRLLAEAETIVRKIADGHNDPRSLCADWVERMDANKK